MLFVKEDVVFVSFREFKSKAGNDLCFITVADPVTYENYDCMPVKSLDYKSLVVGTHYRCEVNCGRYTSINLLPLKRK